MRLIQIKKSKYHNELVLCKMSIIVDSRHLELKGLDIFGWDTQFIGLVEDWDDAKSKFPEYFL